MPNAWKGQLSAPPHDEFAGWAQLFATPLTRHQLDRLRQCAEGNTLRFESAEIVATLVAGGYVRENICRIVTVTPKGHLYLKMHPTRGD